MKLRYLHISDLHLTDKGKAPVESFNQDIVTGSMLKNIAEYSKEGNRIDFLILTGDLAKKGKTEEYEVVKIFCQKLLEITKLSVGKIKSFLRECDALLREEGKETQLLLPKFFLSS